MDKPVPGTRIAERMLTRPEGATMSEIIAATGGPQYNVLKRLKSKGCAVRETREGRETRYHVAVPKPVYELSISDKGQVTLPKGLREEMRVYEGQKMAASIEGGKIVITPKINSIQDLFGILGKPPNSKRVTLEDMREAVIEGVVERYQRAVKRRK